MNNKDDNNPSEKKTYQDWIDEIDKKVESIIKTFISQKGLTGEKQDEARSNILKAYEYAKEAHKSQVRKSGEPYIAHPVAAADILLDLNPDIKALQAAFLHDVIEDTPRTKEDIEQEFGEEVAFLCYGLEKLSKVRYKGEERSIGSLRKMFVAMAEDLRVIFVKLSDRLHNMQTLGAVPEHKRQRIAKETLNIYAPIAGRLGLYKMKTSLEKECFKHLYPEDYASLKKQLERLKKQQAEFRMTAIQEFEKLLEENNIEGKVSFRIKSMYSIYQKMQRKQIDNVEDLYDFYGIRVIVNDVADCYRVLGQIHTQWHTLPYRFKDYIAMPKTNGYQSIHTTIIGFLKRYSKKPIEIQIRTQEMHEHAEKGVAAHFEYKEKGSQVSKDVKWVNELKEVMENLENNEFMTSLQSDTFKKRIYVFTPNGDTINLPKGSTPIDFAYYIHSDVGDHASIAKVNSIVTPLDRELNNGDVVEIITDKNRNPSPFWLSFVQTVRAKQHIRQYISRGDKELYRERGKQTLNEYLEKSGLEPLDKDLSHLKVLEGRENNMQERWSILEQVGNFSITPISVIKKIFKAKGVNYEKPKKKSLFSIFDKKDKSIQKKDKKIRAQIIIGDEENIKYRLCEVCGNKGLPEKIVAHINNKGDMTIHDRSCKVLKDVNKDRLIPAYYSDKKDEVSYFKIELKVENRPGILKEMSEILFQMNINVESIETKRITHHETGITLSIEVPDYDYLLVDRFLNRLSFAISDSLFSYKIEEVSY